MKLADLKQAIREFVPLGGLKTWGVRIRFVDALTLVEVSATVPDCVTGRDREIAYRVPVSLIALEARQDIPNAREYLREILHEFVAHEADEGTGFRERAPIPVAGWWEQPGSCLAIPTTPAIRGVVERPFDPHADENRKAVAG